MMSSSAEPAEMNHNVAPEGVERVNQLRADLEIIFDKLKVAQHGNRIKLSIATSVAAIASMFFFLSIVGMSKYYAPSSNVNVFSGQIAVITFIFSAFILGIALVMTYWLSSDKVYIRLALERLSCARSKWDVVTASTSAPEKKVVEDGPSGAPIVGKAPPPVAGWTE